MATDEELMNQRFNDAEQSDFITRLREMLRMSGSGGVGQGILSGGGRVALEMPVDKQSTITPYVRGGGAIGSVNTPEGKMRVKEFNPEFGINYMRRW